MAHKCPRCGGQVQRKSSTAAGVAGGAVGALIASAFSGFQCKDCQADLATKDFPPEVQSKIRRGSIIMVASAVVILGAVVVALVLFKGR